jgi:site-specific DNA-methyltransferase (adenine-specific)
MLIEPNSIINGDCLEVMKFIPDKSIDCIICDLPYGITACKWDTVIPFEPLWEQYKRIIKLNGAIVLFGSQPFTSALVMSNPKWFKYEWIWDKKLPSGFQIAKYRPMQRHENVLIFSNGTPKYNPIMTDQKPRKGGGFKTSSSSSPIKNVDGELRDYTEKYPQSILEFYKRDKGTIHPTQKAVALIEYLIKTYTKEGELILDNTAGSGTLAIACINTDRRYICIEKDEHYFEVMRTRIANHDPHAPAKPKRTSKPKPITDGQLKLL